MIKKAKVGKYTLESLTKGMYSDAKIIYREYIQNSVDSIDDAVREGIVKREDAYIDIYINSAEKKIIIEDNGTGIPNGKAYEKLTDVGNSEKQYEKNRGFRGIGRLGGLSYCDKLIFETSYAGESIKTRIVYDCVKLDNLLAPFKNKEYDLSDVLEQVAIEEPDYEDKDKHYFRVVMIGVKDVDEILVIEEVKQYITQVAPLPFNLHKFVWASKIKEEFRKNNFELTEYNIFLIPEGGHKQQLYKPNRGSFGSDVRNKKTDRIQDIEFIEIRNNTNRLMALMWYAKCEFFGTITEDSIKGLRFRKGNILIGDKSTLSIIFTQERFNGWFQGEIYILDDGIIPNARRDQFEKSPEYILLERKLKELGRDLSSIVSRASQQRNNDDGKKITKANDILSKVEKQVELGFNSKKEKEQIIHQLEKQLETLSTVKKEDSRLKQKVSETLRKAEELSVKVKESNNYKVLTLPSKYSKKEKEIVKTIFEVLSDELEKDLADKIIKKILVRLK